MVSILHEIRELVVEFKIVIVFYKGYFESLDVLTRDDNGAGVLNDKFLVMGQNQIWRTVSEFRRMPGGYLFLYTK